MGAAVSTTTRFSACLQRVASFRSSYASVPEKQSSETLGADAVENQMKRLQFIQLCLYDTSIFDKFKVDVSCAVSKRHAMTNPECQSPCECGHAVIVSYVYFQVLSASSA
jgi:hypothetical protein